MAAHTLSRLPSLQQLYPKTTCTSSRSPSSYISLTQTSTNPWLVGTPLTFSLPSSNPNSLFSPARPRIATPVSLSLPTGNPEMMADRKFPKWSARAIKSFAMGELEARKLKYTNTGTEALLMGILIEGTSCTAKFLRELGITLTKVKDESVKLLGKGEFFFFSPEHPALTDAAQRALDYAVGETLKSGLFGRVWVRFIGIQARFTGLSGYNKEIMASNLFLGIWSEEGSPGQKILASLGFDDEKAQQLRTQSSECGPDED